MSFKDVYKKMLLAKGGSVENSDKINSTNSIIRQFKNDPSYKRAILIKPKLVHKTNDDLVNEEEEIDVRVVNTDKADLKKFYLLPDVTVPSGSYIKTDQGTYLTTESEWNLLSPYCKGTKCNQVIRINEHDFLFSIISGESYGVKLISTNGGYYTESDTKVKALVQKNDLSRNIPLGFRFMIDKSKEGIYRLGDLSVYNDGYYAFTCAKDNYMDGDDLETGICFNGQIKPEHPTNIKIEGEDDIVVNKEYVYTVSISDNYTFKLEDYAIENNIATIISSTSNKVIIKAIKPDEVFKLIVLKDNKQVASKTIMSVRR